MDEEAAFSVTGVKGSPELATITAGLLDRLPAWFGNPASNLEYTASARRLPGYLARGAGGDPIGVVLTKRHFAETAEVYLLAVHPDRHRQGVGTALLAALASELRADGCRMLQVKTLGPSHPDRGYELTRAFYRAAGFIPVEEIHGLWGDIPCLQLIKTLTNAGG
jgi:GNAT superfamily N-acetyltransferase